VVERATNFREKHLVFRERNRAWAKKVKKFTSCKPTNVQTKRYGAMLSEIEDMCNRRARLEDALIRAAAAYAKAIEEYNLRISERSGDEEGKEEAGAEALVLTWEDGR
jgi:hypothetical protein